MTRALTLGVVFFLAACGDDITEINANVGAVKSSDDLPACTEDIAGQTAYIKETHEFLGCDGKEWMALGANTVSVGDNVCTSTSLNDGTGFEIFCNGESIGTVKNGKDGADGENGKDGAPGAKGDKGDDGTNGKDGEPGAKGDPGDPGKDGTDGTNGTGCTIKESTALTATIACGSETFTMDLTGYVEQPEACDTTVNDEDCSTLQGSVDLSGVSQKGPFVTGTDITAYELQNGRSLKQTGKTFGGKIERADGTFDIKTVKLNSAFAYIVADGFYRNEVTGENSSAAIKLRALTNLKGRSSANINLVTHLEYDRVQYLVTRKDSSVTKAKMAAEKELFTAFGINNSGFEGLAEDLNVLKEGKGNAALLAISVLLQGDRNESELTALLAALSVDLGDNGQWDDSLRRAQVADWAMKTDLNGGLSKIRANVEGWKLAESAAPAFEQHVTNFWMKELDVDKCDSSNVGALFAVKNKNSANYAANDSAYTDGDSSLVRLICAASGDSFAWRFATDIEKDVAALPAELTEGTATTGKINTGFVYVKDSVWRRGTVLDTALRASCVAANRGLTDSMTVKHVVSWYICDKGDDDVFVPFAWRTATTAEADTALFGVPTGDDPIARIGNVTKSHYYVYEDTSGNGDYVWRFGTAEDLVEGLGACTESNLGNIRQMASAASSKNGWYRCSNDKAVTVDGKQVRNAWREATNYEMDTHNREGVFGELIRGSVNDNLFYVMDSTGWRPATSLESSGLGACTSEQNGLIKPIDSLKAETWYRCTDENIDRIDTFSVAYTWRKAADIEKDTSGWGIAAEGDVRAGAVNNNLTYVFEDGKWRQGTRMDVALGLSCILDRRDTLVEESQFVWYKCFADTADDLTVSSSWRRIVESELDRSYWNCFKDTLGKLLTGPYSGKTMVWDNDMFRESSEFENTLGRACVSYMYGNEYVLNDDLVHSCSDTSWSRTGTFEDVRDHRIYKAITINGVTWMAENLDFTYKVGKSTPGDSVEFGTYRNGDNYGAYYIWSAAMDSAAIYSESSSKCGYYDIVNCTTFLCGDLCRIYPPARGVCPEGWHVPSLEEWNALFTAVGGEAKSLQATGYSSWPDGNDKWGFSARPFGYRTYNTGVFFKTGTNANFWVAKRSIDPKYANSQNVFEFGISDGHSAYAINISSSEIITETNVHAHTANSVRCIRD